MASSWLTRLLGRGNTLGRDAMAERLAAVRAAIEQKQRAVARIQEELPAKLFADADDLGAATDRRRLLDLQQELSALGLTEQACVAALDEIRRVEAAAAINAAWEIAEAKCNT